MEVRMKIYHWLLPALSLFPASAAAQMAGYEYWTDGNDTQRTYVEQTQGSVGAVRFAVISSVWEKRMTAPAWPHANMP